LQLAVDSRFEQVMRHCAQLRGDGLGTWIGDDMLAAYCDLHHIGHAHSVEILDGDGQLVGGLYGIAVGRAFFGESMFSEVQDASKVALVALRNILERGGFKLIDCQVESEHLNSLGAENISRLDFERMLAHTIDIDHDPGIWRLPATCGELL
jgi:leucyl/phenylalanyl-tRNA--protein transferase